MEGPVLGVGPWSIFFWTSLDRLIFYKNKPSQNETNPKMRLVSLKPSRTGFVFAIVASNDQPASPIAQSFNVLALLCGNAEIHRDLVAVRDYLSSMFFWQRHHLVQITHH